MSSLRNYEKDWKLTSQKLDENITMLKYIEKKNNNSFLLHVSVKTNSNKQEIIMDGENLTIRIRSKPIQNKANKELLDFLRKKVQLPSNQVKILSGLKSPDKVIELRFPERIDEKQLLDLLNLE